MNSGAVAGPAMGEAEGAGVGTLTRRVLIVCDAIGQFIEYWGFKAIQGRVWGLLALSRSPLPQTEIARLLGVSRSLVSMTIAELSEYGLVRPARDGRAAPYEAVIDVWPTISDVLRSREWMLLESARLAIEAAIDEAEWLKRRGGALPWDVERLRLLLQMTELAQALLRFLMGRRLPRPRLELMSWLRKTTGRLRRLG